MYKGKPVYIGTVLFNWTQIINEHPNNFILLMLDIVYCSNFQAAA
jgi:hypothetical protein